MRLLVRATSHFHCPSTPANRCQEQRQTCCSCINSFHTMLGAHSQAVTRGRSRLDTLPDQVIHDIAVILHGKDTGAVLRLALAASGLFAPCLRFAIEHVDVRRDNPFSSRMLRRSHAKTIELSSELVNKFVMTKHATDGRGVQWMLVLPFRDIDRTCIATSSETCRVSRKWTLLPLPLSQLRQFYFEDAGMGLTRQQVPPRCRDLVLSDVIPWVTIALPESITSLKLAHVVAPTWPEENFGALPPRLQALTIDSLQNDADHAAFVRLLALVPSSLRSLTLKWDLSRGDIVLPRTAMDALAQAIQRLPSLTEFLVSRFRFALHPSVLGSLPRDGFQSLRLSAAVVTDMVHAQLAALDQCVAQCPRIVQNFRLVIKFPVGSHLPPELHRMVSNLPLATYRLKVDVPLWDATMGAHLPLAVPLKELILGCMPMPGPFRGSPSAAVAALAQIVSRLPETLTLLRLSKWPIAGTAIAGLLSQHMPPHLTHLALMECGLTDQDLAQLAWPSRLHTLHLHGNMISTGPVGLPARLRVLELNLCWYLGDQDVAWVHALPCHLETLNVRSTRVGDQFAAALLTRMSRRDSKQTKARLAVLIGDTRVSAKAEKRLASKFWTQGSWAEMCDGV
ncbi:hypothetical protein AMAG_13236 [Allomyces macrogynus ATCC 38327]|uniref:Uncharacterized protein n=1 Tax=Allomyces macrogynus (strain ATCC 38327) TaxID=578462 RepID=A0A0L0SZV3_ALLM3|nr:hypothetical protein AMAG_13236 [Allomyces macrogynus ATCC 38327]|eukprot:KNE68063.1 hypothetical protein AMAG_13236 [Allomyces macrogynus ATCC 38327]